MDFRQIEAFAAVVEHKSFSQAAEALHVTQPTISSHVKSLESEVGRELITRTTKQLYITEDGYRFYEYASSLLKLRQKALHDILNNSDTVIHISASTIPSAYILPEIIAKYKRTRPDVTVSVTQSDSGRAVERLIEGNADIGIVGSAGYSDNVNYIEFLKDRLVICAPPEKHYRELKESGADLRTLLKEPIILRERSSGTKKEAENLLRRMDISDHDLNVAAYMNDMEAIKKCVSGGLGISIVSALSVIEEAERGDLLVLEPEELSGGRSFYVALRKDYAASAVVEDFIGFLINNAGGSEL